MYFRFHHLVVLLALGLSHDARAMDWSRCYSNIFGAISHPHKNEWQDLNQKFQFQRENLLTKNPGAYGTQFKDVGFASPGQMEELKPFHDRPFFLSSETGRERLKAVRIGLSWDQKSLSREVFSDYLKVMDEIPNFDLYVSYKPESILKNGVRSKGVPLNVQKIMSQAKSSIQKRVHFLQDDLESNSVVWTQDGSKPLIGKNLSTLATTTHPKRPEYLQILQEYDHAKLIETSKTTLFFEGGDVVVGDRHIFTGTETIKRMMSKYKITRPNAKKILEAEWGKPVFEVGTTITGQGSLTRAIDYHIDLTMASAYNHATNKETILLGSYQSLLDQLKTIPESEFKTAREKELIKFISDPENISHLADRELQVEALEKDLIAQGYDVIKVPNVIEATTKKDVPKLNYTNVIFTGNQMIFPENGIRAIDAHMKKVYQGLGYQPVPVKVVQKSMQLEGGIRCLSETYRHSDVRIPQHQK